MIKAGAGKRRRNDSFMVEEGIGAESCPLRLFLTRGVDWETGVSIVSALGH